MEVGKIGKTDRHHMFIPPAPPICNLCAPIYGNYVKDLQQIFAFMGAALPEIANFTIIGQQQSQDAIKSPII